MTTEENEQGRKMYRRDLALNVARQLFSVEASILDTADLIESAIEQYSNPCEAIFDHKWLDEGCASEGCKSLFIASIETALAAERKAREEAELVAWALCHGWEIRHSFPDTNVFSWIPPDEFKVRWDFVWDGSGIPPMTDDVRAAITNARVEVKDE